MPPMASVAHRQAVVRRSPRARVRQQAANRSQVPLGTVAQLPVGAAPDSGPLDAGAVLELQRTVGNAAVAAMLRSRAVQRAADAPAANCGPKLDPRAICDDLHLRASFWDSDAADGSRLDTAFHNNRPLTAADNGPNVVKFQEALIEVGFDVGKDGADGKWGQNTSTAVANFQSKNGIQPGGFEAGRKTFLALDSHLESGPSQQTRKPVVHITPTGGVEATPTNKDFNYTIRVIGDDYTRNKPALITFDDAEEVHAVTDQSGHFERTLVAKARPSGAFPVRAAAGTEVAEAKFQVPAPVNPTDPTQINETLELKMDEVLLAYQDLVNERLTGLLDVERDLRGEPEKAKRFKDYFMDVVIFAAERTIEGLLNIPIGRFFAGVQKALKVDNPEPTDPPGVADVFSELQNIALDATKKFLGVDDLSPKGAREPALRKYIDSIRVSTTEEGLKITEKFSKETKPRIRTMTGTPKTPGNDFRVEFTESLLKSVRSQTATASDVEYDEVIQNWASADSRVSAGQKEQVVDGEKVVTTDMSKADDKTPGVLILELEGETPDREVKITQATLSGFTGAVRARLQRELNTVLSLGLPVLATGKARLPNFSFHTAELQIARDERGGVIDQDSNAAGKTWLRDRVAVENGRLGDQDLIKSLDPQKGAELVFNEDLDPKLLQNVPGGLGAP
jgi:putative peptidoglycan binding protein